MFVDNHELRGSVIRGQDTPTECERLQGYADGHTNIEYGRPRNPDQICPDGPRYEAIGNGMAEPVMRWIFERVDRALIRDAATADSGNETSGEDPQDV